MVTAPPKPETPKPETPKPETPKPEPSVRLTPEIMDWLVAFTDANPGIMAQAMAGGQMITAVRQGAGMYLRWYLLES